MSLQLLRLNTSVHSSNLFVSCIPFAGLDLLLPGQWIYLPLFVMVQMIEHSTGYSLTFELPDSG